MKLKKYCFPFFLFLTALAFFACSKGDDSVPKPGNQSRLNIINAVTDTKAINFYLNGTRQNINSAIYLFNASGYVIVPTGEQQYQFKSDSPRVALTDIKLNLAKKDSLYTLFVAGQINNHTLSTIFLSDYFVTDTLNMAKIRFVQASPGATTYDVAVGDTVKFNNQAFKAASSFVNVNPGVKRITVKASGSNVALIDVTAQLQPNSYYTLFTVGSLTGSGNNAFDIGLNLTR